MTTKGECPSPDSDPKPPLSLGHSLARGGDVARYLRWRFRTMNGRGFILMLIFGPFNIGSVILQWEQSDWLRSWALVAAGLIVTTLWFAGPFLWYRERTRRYRDPRASWPWMYP